MERFDSNIHACYTKFVTIAEIVEGKEGPMSDSTDMIQYQLEALNKKLDIIIAGQANLMRRWDEAIAFRNDKTQIMLELLDLHQDVRLVKECLGVKPY